MAKELNAFVWVESSSCKSLRCCHVDYHPAPRSDNAEEQGHLGGIQDWLEVQQVALEVHGVYMIQSHDL